MASSDDSRNYTFCYFLLFSQKRAKKRHNKQINKERVDRIDASLVKLLSDKKNQLNSVVWIHHLDYKEIDKLIRENIAYVNQEEQRKIEELGKEIQKLSTEAEGLEQDIRKYSEQQLNKSYTGSEEKSSVIFTPSYLADNIGTAFLQILPFEEPNNVKNYTKEFEDEVDLNVKKKEREVLTSTVSRGTQGYFDLFKIGNTLQDHQDKYNLEPENFIGRIYTEIYNKRKCKEVLAQREAVIEELDLLISEFEKRVNEVYNS